MVIRRLTPTVLLFAAACVPQNAVLTEGEYIAFLSETTSFSLEADKVDPDDWANTWNIDCRVFENKNEAAALQLEDPIDVCRPKRDGGGVDIAQELWLDQSPYRVLREDLAPWRGEAVITGEEDFQVTFHHRLPGGEDFRFAFVVDPKFQPTDCAVDANGDVEAVPLDGDWVANWTEDLRALGDLKEVPAQYKILEPFIDDPNAKLYYLNARGYQIDPGGDGTEVWLLPLEWRAGYGAGKFSEEEFHTRSPRWGLPALYDAFDLYGSAGNFDDDDLYFCDTIEPGSDPSEDACMNALDEEIAQTVEEMTGDLAMVGITTDGPEGGDPIYAPMHHNNFWRVPDGFPPGLDAWQEIHYNYVVLSGNVEPGGSVKGAFSLLYDSDDSASRWLVQGTFEVDKIKKDRWITQNLQVEKHKENGTFSCKDPQGGLTGAPDAE